MADDSEMGSSPDAGRPRRPPPTIELKAAEVTDKPVKAEPVMPKPDVPEAPPEPIDTAPSDMPPFDSTEPVVEDPAPPPRARAPILVPAAVGAVAGALVAGIAWFALGGGSGSDKSDVDALTARIAKIEARPTATPDAGLTPRIDALEKSIASIRTDLAAARTQSDRIAADLNQLKSAPRGAAAAVDLGPINERLAQIERAAGDLKTAAAQQNAKPVDDTALRRVVAASLLDTSVRQGEPYAAALTAVKPMANEASLKPLDAFATSGVPSAAALSRDLLALLPKLAPKPVDATTSGTGILDRLQAGASKLVQIERTDVTGGSDTNGAVLRATTAARSNDVATAKRELLTLSPADRAVVQPWIDRVDARDAALLASRQFAADAVAALSKPAP